LRKMRLRQRSQLGRKQATTAAMAKASEVTLVLPLRAKMLVSPEPGRNGFGDGREAVGDFDPEHDLNDQVGDNEGG
jgi:hypothetical protein